MELHLIGTEIGVLILALGIVLLDLWTPAENKSRLGYVAAIGTALLLVFTFVRSPYVTTLHFNLPGSDLAVHMPEYAFNSGFVQDDLAIFFKRLFLLAAILVLVMSVAFAERILAGIAEFYGLILFALAGMMFAASANNFPMLFVSIELITVAFYILTSFERSRQSSLEAGVKYLILGALASAFLVYGIALVYGTSGTMNFNVLAEKAGAIREKPLFLLGLLLIIGGLAFKVAAFPLQIWAPDVYQGSPAPVTAFLAVGSKAAGFVLLLRVLFVALPAEVVAHWRTLLMVMAAVTILYGNLCAIPQRNLKRLFGYSSIANAGYLLMGVAALNAAGKVAILFYLGGYLFTVLAAFTVICLVLRAADVEDITSLAGLHRRSPLLAAVLTLSMASLAGVPPLAGFFGKFLLFKAALEQGPAYYWLVAVAILGVIISFYYYFGVVRAIYWSREPAELSPLPVSLPLKVALGSCVIGMVYLGAFPSAVLRMASQVVAVLR